MKKHLHNLYMRAAWYHWKPEYGGLMNSKLGILYIKAFNNSLKHPSDVHARVMALISEELNIINIDLFNKRKTT